MVTLTALWLPILLSAVAVFMASSVAHALLRYHDTDARALPGESAILEAMGKALVQWFIYAHLGRTQLDNHFEKHAG